MFCTISIFPFYWTCFTGQISCRSRGWLVWQVLSCTAHFTEELIQAWCKVDWLQHEIHFVWNCMDLKCSQSNMKYKWSAYKQSCVYPLCVYIEYNPETLQTTLISAAVCFSDQCTTAVTSAIHPWSHPEWIQLYFTSPVYSLSVLDTNWNVTAKIHLTVLGENCVPSSN